LPEPSFNVVAKSPSTPEGTKGLLTICRLCVAVGVWAPGNEKVIRKIQGLEERQMAELMKGIEEVSII
jgi:protein HOOK3